MVAYIQYSGVVSPFQGFHRRSNVFVNARHTFSGYYNLVTATGSPFHSLNEHLILLNLKQLATCSKNVTTTH